MYVVAGTAGTAAFRALADNRSEQAVDAVVAYYEDAATCRREVREALTALPAMPGRGKHLPDDEADDRRLRGQP